MKKCRLRRVRKRKQKARASLSLEVGKTFSSVETSEGKLSSQRKALKPRTNEGRARRGKIFEKITEKKTIKPFTVRVKKKNDDRQRRMQAGYRTGGRGEHGGMVR